MSTTIELKNLTTGYKNRYGNVAIERNITASINSGEFTCLLGPNGAGKTTLLRTLSGFLSPLSGDILIDGRNIKSYTDHELAKRISVVLTERPAVTSMTVVELVSLGRSPYTGFWERLSDNDLDIINTALKDTGIEHLRNRRFETLSDGERQKVMIAKSLSQETPLIFLDEPTAFLDFPSKVDMMRLLKKLAHEKNKTIFQSTHDLNMALCLADKIWLVDKKIGVRIGTPNELADSGDLEKFFLRDGITFDREKINFLINTL
jgi:iron complex transport system ATP-binding protein